VLRPAVAGKVNFVVPAVHEDLSGKGAIVSEFMPSYELDNGEITQQGFDASDISQEVGLEILRMLVQEQYYQSDVNLGNFGVLKDSATGSIVRSSDGTPTVVWYDAGAVAKIEPEDQKLLLKIVLAAASNPNGLPDLVRHLVNCSDDQAGKLRQICEDFRVSLQREQKLELKQLGSQMCKFIDMLSDTGFVVQDKWLVIVNMLSMVAPLLAGIDEKRVSQLMIEAMSKHNLLTFAQKIKFKLASLFN
jgi:predicted unusual protein kinase regulating ubiquinone biosynthesis (AarF/ABC1/UbiB family)